MLSKTKRPYDPAALPAEKRLRANVQDLFANNLLSGKRIQELVNDAAGAGASSMGSLTRKDDKNATRHLRSKFLKRNQWPDIYRARIRGKDKNTGRGYTTLSLLLAARVLGSLATPGHCPLHISDAHD